MERRSISRVHSELVSSLHSTRLTRDWLSSMAQRGYNDYLGDITGIFSNDDVLYAMGLLQQDDHLDNSPVRKEEDRVIAKALYDHVRNQIAQEVAHMRFYSDRPPYAFLAIFSSDEGVEAVLLLHISWFDYSMFDFGNQQHNEPTTTNLQRLLNRTSNSFVMALI